MAEMETVDIGLDDVRECGWPAAVLDVLDTAMLLVRVQAAECRCIAANRRFVERYARGEEVHGRPPSAILPPAPAALLEAAARRTVDTGERWAYADVADEGGSTVDVTVVPLPGFADLVVWAAGERDRRQRDLERESHRLEEANTELSRSNADLAEFAYVASHDLTEPLRMVASHLDLVRMRHSDALDEQALRSIDYAIEGAERMRALVGALLELAQVSTQPVVRAPVPLADVVEDVLADLDAVIREAGAEVAVGELPVVFGDRKTLTSLVANLVSNAVKFRSDPPPPRIRIDAERVDSGWRVCVADNGIGIRPEHRTQAFEMFRRLQARSKHPGTGMGLAICRRIVERHGGTISIEDNEGGGTVLSFTLPEPKAAS